MKKSILIRTAILILILLSLLTGCEKAPSIELPSEPSEPTGGQTLSETEQAIALKWENAICNTEADIKSIFVVKHIVQPLYVSTLPKFEAVTLADEVSIEELLNIVRNLDVSFEDFEPGENEMGDLDPSHIGKQTITISLKDSAEEWILHLYLYQNGDISIRVPHTVTENKEYSYMSQVYFEDSNTEVFTAIAKFFEFKCENKPVEG